MEKNRGGHQMEFFMSVWSWVNDNPALAAIVGTFIGGLFLAGFMWMFEKVKGAINNDELSDGAKRQLNAYNHKLERLIDIGELLNELIDRDVELEEEQKRIESENIKRENAEDYQSILLKRKEWDERMKKLGRKLQQISIEFNNLPKDELPPDIHAEVMGILESKKVQLDLTQQKKLLKKIKKVI